MTGGCVYGITMPTMELSRNGGGGIFEGSRSGVKSEINVWHQDDHR